MSSERSAVVQPAIAPGDSVMILAMFAAGIAAAVTADPVFWLTTPLIAYIVLRVARREQIADDIPATPSEFPPSVDAAIRDALERLPAGDARRLLAAVVRESRPLFAMTSSSFAPAEDNQARTHAAELVLAACDTALELARLDSALASRSLDDAKSAAHDKNLPERFRRARELFATRLSDAAGALGALYASGVEHGTPASDRVAELVTDLTADAGARRSAKRELDELLSPKKPG